MTKKQRIRIYFRFLMHTTKERAYDLWNIAVPIFVTSGLIVACVKFWWWVL